MAVVPAAAVAVILTGAGLTLLRGALGWMLGTTPVDTAFEGNNWGAWLGGLAWLPWGVALGLATLGYSRRRRDACRACETV